MENKISMSDYERIIDKLSFLVRYYENGLIDNQYDIYLANGDKLYLTFPKNHIAHILGVYTEKLKKGTNQEDSYKILKKLIDSNPSYFDLKRMFGEDNVGTLFSKYIDRKIETFLDTLKIRTDDIYCIIKYKTDRSYATGENTQNSDYFIIRQHENTKYSALGICKGNTYDEYVPVTSRLFEDKQELEDFLKKIAKHQEITYPTILKIVNEPKKFNNTFSLSPDEKLNLASNLVNIGSKFEAIPSNTKDSMYVISKAIDGKQKRFTNYSILKGITECIKEGTYINKEVVMGTFGDKSIPGDISELIDASNDIICANYRNDEYKGKSYSEVSNENIKLKQELENLKLTLQEKDALIEGLQETNQNLNTENEEKTRKLNVLNEAFRSIQ